MIEKYMKLLPYDLAYQAISLYSQIDHKTYIWLIELIESFKKNEIAAGIKQVNTTIFNFLKSNNTSPQIAQYFQLSDIEELPFTHFDHEPDNISQIKKLVNALYHAELTFRALENINIRELGRDDLKQLFEKTIESAYEASYLATQLDIDLKSMFFNLNDVSLNLHDVFKEEYKFAAPYLKKIPEFDQIIEQKIATSFQPILSFSNQAGHVSGITADQMRPIGGDIDYNFLTKFTGELPGYIRTLREKITKYRLEIREQHKEINQEKLDTLQEAVNNLLSDLETLKENSIFMPVNFLHCIHTGLNIIFLVKELMNTQLGHLNTEMQDSVYDKLDRLKYTLLPTLFGLIDNIEVNCLLKPGFLSIPLMKEVNKLYETILYLPEKIIDFKKREDLLCIENSRFVALRLKLAYQRINAANTVLHQISRSQEALTAFFHELNKSEYKDLCLHELPVSVKTKLIEHYILIKPYMMQVDVDCNKQIITGLINSKKSWSSFLATPVRGITGMLPEDHISLIVAKQEALENLLFKNFNTQLFHIDMNENLINSVHRQTNLALSPYTEETNVYVIDESTPLPLEKDQFLTSSEHTLIKNPEELTSDQALLLWEWYEDKFYKFDMAQKAYKTFYDELNLVHKDHLPPFNISKLRELYNVFQSYFVCAVLPELEKPILEQLDRYLVALLSNKKTETADNILIEQFLKLDKPIQDYFAQTKVQWKLRSHVYFQLMQRKSGAEHQIAQLICVENNDQRTRYLSRVYEVIFNFRTELSNTSQLFNNPMQQQLKPQRSSRIFNRMNDLFPDTENIEQQLEDQQLVLPFPEMEDLNQRLAQSKQVRAIKDIYNNFYHLERIIFELMQLNHENLQNSNSAYAKAKKVIYVYRLIMAYTHINQIIQLSQRLATDPHSKLIFNELINKAQNFYAIIQEQTDAYQASPETKAVDNLPLWYSLNAFYNAPAHIRSVRNINFRTTEECKELSQKAQHSSLVIQEIINNSSSRSYFKLFLQTPHMIFLYHELVRKLNEFTTTSHDAVLDNLDKMRSALFTPILLEADNWEHKLGLVPGTFSDGLRKITNEYYKGFLDALQLNSQKHIALICDKTPLKERIKQTKKHLTKAKESIKKTSAYSADIIALHERMLEYKEQLSKSRLNPELDSLNVTVETIRSMYQKILPKLAQLILDQKINPSDFSKEPLFDDFCNEGLKEYDPHYENIESLVAASCNYFLGLKATYTMKINTAHEKLEHFTKLKIIQNKEKQDFILKYTDQAFEKHLHTLCNPHNSLQFTDKEYNAQLEAYLRIDKKLIIKKSKRAIDINLNIQELLKEKIGAFEKEHLEEYYHLDSIRAALARFKVYFTDAQRAYENKLSIFENEKTLSEKSILINDLEKIAEDTELSIKERVQQIKAKVENSNFKRIILKYKQADTFFNYLAICFTSLLEALYLYEPTKNKLLRQINQQIVSPLKYQELTKRFGLFSSAPTDTAKKPSKKTKTTSNPGPGVA